MESLKKKTLFSNNIFLGSRIIGFVGSSIELGVSMTSYAFLKQIMKLIDDAKNNGNARADKWCFSWLDVQIEKSRKAFRDVSLLLQNRINFDTR